jgi:hypothetical protein
MLDWIGIEDQTCVEVGVQDGIFSTEILRRKPKMLFLVDPWVHQPPEIYPERSNRSESEFAVTYQKILDKFAKHRNITILREFSIKAAKQIKQKLDFVYIDAIHTYESCSADIRAWYPKLRNGGWLAGHDYTNYRGVRQAVDEFVAEKKLDDLRKTSEKCAASWFLQKP